MPGRIFRRGSRYVLRVYAGREDGKKRDKWFTFPTFREAEAVQRELASHTLAHSGGTGYAGSPRERLGPYLEDWLARQKQRLAPSTHARYQTFVAQIRCDAIGTVSLARLTPRALESYYGRRLEHGLSPTTVYHHHRFLHKALQDAVRQDLMLKNPAHLADPPKRGRPQPNVWTEAQLFLFLSEAKVSSPHYALYVFLAFTGSRLGEALGIRWRDIDLKQAEVRILQTLQRTAGGGYVLKAPKTHRSSRVIALPTELTDELRALHAQQTATRVHRAVCERGAACMRAGCTAWHELDLVFCQPNGRPLHANNVRRRDLRPLCEALGLPWRRALHNLRHAHGSHLLQRGVSVKVVQERLGHSSPAFTLGVYAHVLAGMQEQAARVVSTMIQEARKAMVRGATGVQVPAGQSGLRKALDRRGDGGP